MATLAELKEQALREGAVIRPHFGYFPPEEPERPNLSFLPFELRMLLIKIYCGAIYSSYKISQCKEHARAILDLIGE